VRVLPHGRGRAVAVIGGGYVGLPTAATLAHLGHRVTCGDSDAAKVAQLEEGRLTIIEDHLEELVREGQAAGRLRFVVGAKEAVEGAEFVFLCVPTPQKKDGSADLSYLESVAKEIGPALLPGTVIVNKSTVPVGSTLVVDRVLGRHDVSVVSNPEFLREGTAVSDSLHPERIVVGADDQSAAAKVGELFAGTHAPLLITDAATAEIIKYAANAFLATKLSFVNAVAGLCEALGADVRDVILGLGYDKRIGFEYLRPGPGWGGSSLLNDTRVLIGIAEQAGYDFSFLKGAIAANDEQFVRVVDKVRAAVGGELEGTVIAAWGLTFKAGTDDLRNSPAVEVVRSLVEGGATVRVFDPTIAVPDGQASAPLEDVAVLAPDGEGLHLAGAVRAFPDAYAACEGAYAAVVLTEWDEFRWLDFTRLRVAMAKPVVVDARNLLDPAPLRRIGFEYAGIGRR
jgi:UDPglucose 6-dehydrogenase